QENLTARMNKDLAIILFTNLIQNAIKHGKIGTQIEIIIHKESVMIKNESDHTIPLDVDKIFSRFYKETALQNSTGLGLSIAQAIAKKYGFTVTYTYKDLHCFKVNFQQT
ncbi:MAG: ATP-binding protein, partial [Mesonia sp.]